MDMPSLSKYNDNYIYISVERHRLFFEIPTYRTAAVQDGHSSELCISFDTRKVLQTSTQTSRLGANG